MSSSGKWIDGLDASTPVEVAARRSLEIRLAAVAHALPMAAHLAEHDIEHVHRLRVATRRAAAAVKLYRHWLPRKAARWVKRKLRNIRRAAGEARDLDVLTDRLRRELGAEADAVLVFLADKRKAVQPKIVELADNLRHRDRFVHKTARLIADIRRPHDLDPACASEFGHWAPERLEAMRRSFEKAVPNDLDDIRALHQFRIRGKRLRYAIELLAAAFDSKLRQVVYPEIEELQERLGKITDHIAAMRLLAEWQSHAANQFQPAVARDWLNIETNDQLNDLQDFREWWTADKANWLKLSLLEQSHQQPANITHYG